MLEVKIIDGYLEEYGLDQTARQPVENYINMASKPRVNADELHETFLTTQADLWLHPQYDDGRVLNLLSDLTQRSAELAGRSNYDVIIVHDIAIEAMQVHGMIDPFVSDVEEEVDPELTLLREEFHDFDFALVSRGEVSSKMIQLQRREGFRKCKLNEVFETLSGEARAVAEQMRLAGREEDFTFFSHIADGYQAAAEKSVGTTDPIVVQFVKPE